MRRRPKIGFSDPMDQMFGQQWVRLAVDRLKWKKINLRFGEEATTDPRKVVDNNSSSPDKG